MSTTTHRQRILVETEARRDQARELLGVLVDARSRSEANLKSLGQPDLVKKVTGRSAFDRAIDNTRTMIATFDDMLGDLNRELDPEDLRLLEEIVGSERDEPTRRHALG